MQLNENDANLFHYIAFWFWQRYGIPFKYQNFELSIFDKMGRNKQIIQKYNKITAEMLRAIDNSVPLICILPSIKAVNSAKSLISQMKDGEWQIRTFSINNSEDWLIQLMRID